MAGRAEPLSARIGRRALAAFCTRQVGRQVNLTVEHRTRLPASGPVLLAARHMHHLLDGCILAGQIERPLHVLVAVDWAAPGPQRWLLDRATGVLRWPAVMREGAAGSASAADASRRLRAATREAVTLLHEGQALIVFPEGYPNIDPRPTPKTGLDEILPFQLGAVRIAALAARGGHPAVPIVPVGFWYRPLTGHRWHVVLRFGAPLFAGEFRDAAAAAAEIERRVRELSGPPGA